jgi:hypothetical protein
MFPQAAVIRLTLDALSWRIGFLKRPASSLWALALLWPAVATYPEWNGEPRSERVGAMGTQNSYQRLRHGLPLNLHQIERLQVGSRRASHAAARWRHRAAYRPVARAALTVFARPNGN